MGSSYQVVGIPNKCFNGHKNWLLGWFNDYTSTVNITEGAWGGNITTFVNYDVVRPGEFIIVNVGDLYLQYNRADKFNLFTGDDPNQVTIVKGTSPDARSELLGSVSQVSARPTMQRFENFADTGFALVIEACEQVYLSRVSRDLPDYVRISIHLDDGLQSSTCRQDEALVPSARPSSSPSMAPPPTMRPTKPPTAPPTQPPTEMPSTLPTTAPTKPPTARHTLSPSTLPAIVPTAPPTTPTTESPSTLPTTLPTAPPTTYTTDMPPTLPSTTPTAPPSTHLTESPSTLPTTMPTASPTTYTTDVPSTLPSTTPTAPPSTHLTESPSTLSSTAPTSSPTTYPTATSSVTLTLAPTSGCDDSSPTATFYINELHGHKNCNWLKKHPRWRTRACVPEHEAFSVCEETCGKCTDTCEDEPGTFYVNKRQPYRDCAWLSVRPFWQKHVCREGNAGNELCRETCNRC